MRLLAREASVPARMWRAMSEKQSAIAPPNIKELARMAQIDVNEQEVGMAVCVVLVGRNGCNRMHPWLSCERLQVSDWEPKISSIVEW